MGLDKAGKRLQKGADMAVELLISTLSNEEEALKVRLECAREILNRAYGRGAMAAPSAPQAAHMKLEEGLEPYAE